METLKRDLPTGGVHDLWVCGAWPMSEKWRPGVKGTKPWIKYGRWRLQTGVIRIDGRGGRWVECSLTESHIFRVQIESWQAKEADWLTLKKTKKKTEYCFYYAVLFLIWVTEGAESELESNSVLLLWACFPLNSTFVFWFPAFITAHKCWDTFHFYSRVKRLWIPDLLLSSHPSSFNSHPPYHTNAEICAVDWDECTFKSPCRWFLNTDELIKYWGLLKSLRSAEVRRQSEGLEGSCQREQRLSPELCVLPVVTKSITESRWTRAKGSQTHSCWDTRHTSGMFYRGGTPLFPNFQGTSFRLIWISPGSLCLLIRKRLKTLGSNLFDDSAGFKLVVVTKIRI